LFEFWKGKISVDPSFSTELDEQPSNVNNKQSSNKTFSLRFSRTIKEYNSASKESKSEWLMRDGDNRSFSLSWGVGLLMELSKSSKEIWKRNKWELLYINLHTYKMEVGLSVICS